MVTGNTDRELVQLFWEKYLSEADPRSASEIMDEQLVNLVARARMHGEQIGEARGREMERTESRSVLSTVVGIIGAFVGCYGYGGWFLLRLPEETLQFFEDGFVDKWRIEQT